MISEKLNFKYEKLVEKIRKLERVIIAFSGGVDSTFLLYIANYALSENSMPVIIKTPYMPDWELLEAKQFCDLSKIKLHMIELDIPEKIKNNPENRCYICKKILFQKLIDYGKKYNIKNILDGSNVSDLSDYRPGLRALKELNIISPMVEVGLSKNDIRNISEKLGLPTWNKPAYACMMTRFPFDTPINNEKLKMVEESELLLHKLGFNNSRVRVHNNLARIEIDKSDFEDFLSPENIEKIESDLKKAGFDYITLDISGYKMGSFNLKKIEE